MFDEDKQTGKQEYSSAIVSMYVLREDKGNGPLKSMLNHSIGWVALIRLSGIGR